jgi:hypothetical protein
MSGVAENQYYCDYCDMGTETSKVIVPSVYNDVLFVWPIPPVPQTAPLRNAVIAMDYSEMLLVTRCF